MASENPRKRFGTAHRSIGDEGMVVDSDKALVHVLNPVGNRIFAMLDGTHTLDAIAAAVAEEFNVPAEQARQDVEAFLAELDSQEMLDHSSGQPAVKE